MQAGDAESVSAISSDALSSLRFCCCLLILLNKWSLERDADPAAEREASLRPLADQVREPERYRHL